jgi:two-component system, OmpR family, sensor histidine kinase VanS
MTASDASRQLARAPGLSVRVKLTLSYAAFGLVAGLGVLAVMVFVLLRFVPDGNLTLIDGSWVPNRTNLLAVVYRDAGWAIAGLVAFSLIGGWLLSGFMLRPLQRITDAARRARDGEWDGRVRLAGRQDELTELADTFDALLERVQRTIAAERRFAANASHELRTPLAIVRTLVEVAQADPDGRDVDRTLARIGETNDRAIALTESLLTLARADGGAEIARAEVDLDAVLTQAAEEVAADAAAAGIRIDTDLRGVTTTGEPALLARLSANLVRNAVLHNAPGGRVLVASSATAENAVLAVVNTGAVIPAAVAPTLVEPFVRGAGRIRGEGSTPGSGLGLAIAAAIVAAHGGRLELTPRREGGLQVRALLPR